MRREWGEEMRERVEARGRRLVLDGRRGGCRGRSTGLLVVGGTHSTCASTLHRRRNLGRLGGREQANRIGRFRCEGWWMQLPSCRVSNQLQLLSSPVCSRVLSWTELRSASARSAGRRPSKRLEKLLEWLTELRPTSVSSVTASRRGRCRRRCRL